MFFSPSLTKRSPTRSPKLNIRGSPKHRTLERIRQSERPYQAPEPPNTAADDKEVLAHMTMTFDDDEFRARRTVRRTGSESEAHNKDRVDGVRNILISLVTAATDGVLR